MLWEVPNNVEPGLYRIGHRGYWHTIIRGNIYYEGWSQPFTVTTPDRAQETFLEDVDTALHTDISAAGPSPMSNSGNSLQSPLSLFSHWL